MKHSTKAIYIFLGCLVIYSCSTTQEPSTNASASLYENPFEKSREEVDSILEFNSMMLSIFQDSRGVFWFGSWCDGMASYDPADTFPSGAKKFKYYTTGNGIPGKEIIEFNKRRVPRGNAVRDIREDSKGNIVFATLAGVTMFDGDQFSLLPFDSKEQELSESLGHNEMDWEKEYQSLWYGNINSNGVYLSLIHI